MPQSTRRFESCFTTPGLTIALKSDDYGTIPVSVSLDTSSTPCPPKTKRPMGTGTGLHIDPVGLLHPIYIPAWSVLQTPVIHSKQHKAT